MDKPLSCQPVHQFPGGAEHKLLSRSKLFQRPGSDHRILAAFGDEGTNSVSTRGLLLCKMSSTFSFSIPGLYTSAFLLSKLFNTSGPCVGCVHYLETPAAVAGRRCSSGHHPLWQQPAGVSGCPDQVKALCLPVAMEIGTSFTSVFWQMYHVYILLCLHLTVFQVRKKNKFGGFNPDCQTAKFNSLSNFLSIQYLL